MKQCLILGGGSKFGSYLTKKFIEHGYHVRLVTGNPVPWADTDNVTTIPVNWGEISVTNIKDIIRNIPSLDVVFFNQNSSALNLENFKIGNLQNVSSWQQNYFAACQLPFYLIHSLKHKISHAKIGWMLSNLIRHPIDNQVGYADYIGNKFTNACIMKSFSLQSTGCFFGIHPDGITNDHDSLTKSNNIVHFIDQSTVEHLNGRIFSHSGIELTFG
jgi:hypothetical protein